MRGGLWGLDLINTPVAPEAVTVSLISARPGHFILKEETKMGYRENIKKIKKNREKQRKLEQEFKDLIDKTFPVGTEVFFKRCRGEVH